MLGSSRRPRPGRTPTDPETKSCTWAVRFQKYFIFWNSHNVSALGGLSPRGEAEAMTGRHVTPVKQNDGRVWDGV